MDKETDSWDEFWKLLSPLQKASMMIYDYREEPDQKCAVCKFKGKKQSFGVLLHTIPINEKRFGTLNNSVWICLDCIKRIPEELTLTKDPGATNAPYIYSYDSGIMKTDGGINFTDLYFSNGTIRTFFPGIWEKTRHH